MHIHAYISHTHTHTHNLPSLHQTGKLQQQRLQIGLQQLSVGVLAEIDTCRRGVRTHPQYRLTLATHSQR